MPRNKLPKTTGKFKLIVGCMYASKTSLLQKTIHNFISDGKTVSCFTLDKRYGPSITNHDGNSIKAHIIEDVEEIKTIAKKDKAQLVAIDEVQFYPLSIVNTISELLENGISVVAAGLDQDFLCKPFETTMALVIECDELIKLTAKCNCGNDAIRNYRKVQNNERILQGDDIYEALCRTCYNKKMK